jgi:spore coat polysaccharide biosynthesis predicted glycosyltransferase SpsG
VSTSISSDTRTEISDRESQIGFVVDAGPKLGYGHAVRCLRLANALKDDVPVTFYPLSEACSEFLLAENSHGKFTIREPKFERSSLPSLVITDLREAHGITAAIHRNGSRHISIHDLGLAQCRSDVVIGGSIATLFPYAPDNDRTLYLGPKYMITRGTVSRGRPSDTVLVTFGGGATADFAQRVAEEVWKAGLTPITTRGFIGSSPMTDEELARSMATCRFAISGSGVTLYDLLASGVPTIAVAFDRIQLRTADAFQERGAVLSAGLLERLSPSALVDCCLQMLENRSLIQRLSEVGQMLVDGKGLSRVVEIVRRQLWLTSQVKTFSTC